METKVYHPSPVGQVSKPAPLVWVTYLTDVRSPDFKAGEKGKSKQIEKHWAEQLVDQGFAKYAEPAEVAAAEAEKAEAQKSAEPVAEVTAESEEKHVDSGNPGGGSSGE